MPPRYAAKGISVLSGKCRRSKRIANRMKLTEKGQSATSEKGQSATSKKVQSATSKKGQSATSKKGQSSSSKERKPVSSKRARPTSSEMVQPSTTIRNLRKKRRVVKMEEIYESTSEMEIESASEMEIGDESEDFSSAIEQILQQLAPDLEISKEGLVDMNIYLNNVFERLARQSAILPLGRSGNTLTMMDVDKAIPHVIEGDLGKYCVAEGRRAVKKWDPTEYKAAFQNIDSESCKLDDIYLV